MCTTYSESYSQAMPELVRFDTCLWESDGSTSAIMCCCFALCSVHISKFNRRGPCWSKQAFHSHSNTMGLRTEFLSTFLEETLDRFIGNLAL